MSLNDKTEDFLEAAKPENGLISEVNYPCEQKELHKSKFEKWLSKKYPPAESNDINSKISTATMVIIAPSIVWPL